MTKLIEAAEAAVGALENCAETAPSLKSIVRFLKQEIQKAKKTERFVLRIAGGVEPELIGPFKNAQTRDAKARRVRNADEDDGVFWLNVTNGEVSVGAYSGGFMDGLPGFDA